MQDHQESKGKDSAASRSAAEAATKREQQGWENEGGHMSSMAGRVMHVAGAELPFVAVLTHDGSEATEHGFPTMRKAEAFIKRNTPVPSRTLSPIYDRPSRD
jgi:hypothetical protein